MLAFGLLGFLDDFIKIKYKHNEGLKPYQKIIGQFGISIVIAIIFAVGMIAVFYLEISKFCYYATLTICCVIIVGGIVLMFLAARSMVLTVVFSSGRASLLMALFSLQLRVYYRKRNWLKNDHVKDGSKSE